MKITIETIPHSEQSYDTSGDWRFEGEDLHIYISNLNNWRYEALIAVHEFVEVLLCKGRGITQESVDAFDIRFEKERIEGKHAENDEPGDAVDAPYRKEHFTATNVERILSEALGVDWKEYEDAVYAVSV